MYSLECLEKLSEEFILINTRKSNIYKKLHNSLVKKDLSKFYIKRGIMRRVSYMASAIENIFSLFPPNQDKLLDADIIDRLVMNLQIFCINICGVLDNLALIYKIENDLDISDSHVNLFNKNKKSKKTDRLYIRDMLKEEFREYLESVDEWHDEYVKTYRDSLCHKIPLYIPPYLQDDSGNKSPSFFMLFEKDSKNSNDYNSMNFHPQIIADFMTIEEIICKFFDQFKTQDL